MIFYQNDGGILYQGDVMQELGQIPDESVHCIVTSPPYWGLRDYGHDGQIGLEKTPEAYVAKMVEVFRECRRVLRDDGTLWLNLGDSYAEAGRAHGKTRRRLKQTDTESRRFISRQRKNPRLPGSSLRA